jgi:hypothetical protein
MPFIYRHLKNSMHHLIEEHLDTSKCASSQSPILLKTVRDKVSKYSIDDDLSVTSSFIRLSMLSPT